MLHWLILGQQVVPGTPEAMPDICNVTPDALQCTDFCQINPDTPQCVAARRAALSGELRAKRPDPPEPPEPEPQDVVVRAKPPARSASDWQVDTATLASIPHESGADVLGALPGVYVSNRALLGQAPTLSVRGFEGTSGRDMELFVGNVPMNQISNIRAPGYADLRLVMPEVVRSVRITHGPYDPRQGDFAVAGSAHMDLGLEKPGFVGKGTIGSFGARRAFLAFAPAMDKGWDDTFAAFETYATDGPGTGRGGQRTSFVGQLGFKNEEMSWHLFVLAGTARFHFPGLLAQGDVEDGQYPYSAMSPLGRDLTSQMHVGNEFLWEVNHGTLTLGAFLSRTAMQIHENLTGYVLDDLAGMPPTNADDAEQVNKATTYGLNLSYKHTTRLISERDNVEVGMSARLDSIAQTDTRLFPDGSINVRNADAAIDATGIGGYADLSVYPFPRVVVRGGARVDSLAYQVTDNLSHQGLDRTTQGVHLGSKATVDYAAGGGIHLIASYGEGFRSPEARDLAEGQHIPFATIRSVEAGGRLKSRSTTASLVAFGSWLSQDLVFDPLLRGTRRRLRHRASGALQRWPCAGACGESARARPTPTSHSPPRATASARATRYPTRRVSSSATTRSSSLRSGPCRRARSRAASASASRERPERPFREASRPGPRCTSTLLRALRGARSSSASTR
jgi:iron complex outermembrane receptor protein